MGYSATKENSMENLPTKWKQWPRWARTWWQEQASSPCSSC